MTDPQPILSRHKAAETIRLSMCSIWRDVAAHADPLRRDIGMDAATGLFPSISGGANIFDSSCRDAARTYAAGCMSWMTPSETTWFAYNPPRYLRRDDSAKSWYSECTDIAREILAGTNFYSEIHGVYLDDGIFGTSGLMVRENTRYGLHFEALPIGDYSVLENHLGEVDTLFRVYLYTPRQAAQEFGESKLSEDVSKALADPHKCDTPSVEFLHFIGPRDKRNRFSERMANAPTASIWIERKANRIVRESGFLEAPFTVHRHLKFGHCPYGRSPGMEAVYDARQLNYMQQQLDTLVEKFVSPPVIAPANFEGVIDLRARGITFTPDMQQAPRFWGDQGNYAIGDDRTAFRTRQIHNAFHVELFQALASVPVGKEMTAVEVRARQNDRLPAFSPTFARKNRELNDPVMRLVFAILLRNGAFPPPPRNLLQRTAEGELFIPDPQIVYSSRMALALQSIHNDALLETINVAGAMAQLRPEVLDNFDFDDASRTYARNVGLLESSIVPEQRRDEVRQRRAEEQARAEQEASQLEEADAVAKLAGAAR